jgi:hypothetical protein
VSARDERVTLDAARRDELAAMLRGNVWETRHFWVDENDMEVPADDPTRCNFEHMTGTRTPEELADVLAPLVARWLAEDAAKVLHEAWLRMHTKRFDEAKPDSFYNGILKAEFVVMDVARDRGIDARATLVPGHDHEGGK